MKRFRFLVASVLLVAPRFQFSLRSLFAVMTGAALIAFAWPVIAFVFSMIAEHPPEVWLPAKGQNGINAEVLRFAIGVENGTFFWAVIQWFLHAGPYVAIAVSLLLVTGWFARRTARGAGEGMFNYWIRDRRRRWSVFLRFAGKSAAVAAVCCLIVYLWLAPAVIRGEESKFQQKMRIYGSPQQCWNDVLMARSRILTSANEMQRIHDLVESELGQEDDPTPRRDEGR